MTAPGRVLVVGASLAGATAALTLRELGFDGEVDLVGAEPQLPYERPALSKAYLAGRVALEDLRVHGRQAYDDAAVRLHLGRTAVALDVDRRRVRLADGDQLPYDVLVLATGSVNRSLPVPGRELPGVHALRTVEDADRLRAAAARASAAVVVGQGLVGGEVAATLRTLGLDVTAVDPLPGPLWEALGPQVSDRLAGWHAERGVALVNGAAVAALQGDGRVQQVRLTDGRVLAADLVLVGVGARPASDWLVGSPVRLVGGAVAVDAEGRSSVPGVLAAGDLAAREDEASGQVVHAEHYDAALVQGRRVAHAVVGAPAPPPVAPWFWSEQHDHLVQYGGAHAPDDELVWRGGDTGFWLRAGVVTAVVCLDEGRQFRRALRLVGSPQDRDALCDEGVDLRRLRAGDTGLVART